MVKSHSLLELSKSIESVISRTFNSSYWVRAEISRLNFYPKSGHCYPELVEKKEGKIVAEIRSTIWKGTFNTLTSKFKAETGEELREGMNILFLVQVRYSPTHGVSLNIQNIDPSFTMGEMAKEKKMAIEQLRKENVFNQNHNLPFPYFPQRIAIVSVSTSKGYHDFLETIQNKASRFDIQMTLFPAILQGDVAVKSISEQLEWINKRQSEFDVVLIIRGGGGDVGLHCYNHVGLARLVATFPLPIISGIGHSTNETVVEMVANTNKITPTAVADTLVERFRALETELQYANDLIVNIKELKIAPQWQRLLQATRFLKSSISTPLNNEKLRIQQLISILGKYSNERINRERTTIDLNFKSKIQYLSRLKFSKLKNELELLETKVKILDPKSVLKRGFSMSMVNNKLITEIKSLKKGDILQTTVYNGTIESEITKTSNNE